MINNSSQLSDQTVEHKGKTVIWRW